jgi:RNA polymerase sigma-70 factor (ECF subfamily)
VVGLSEQVGTATEAPVAFGLVARARAGDQAAFAMLVDAHADRAVRIATTILGDPADGRDATQEAFLQAWLHLRGLRDEARFDAWFTRILVNACRAARRARGRRRVREIAASSLDGNADEAADDLDLDARSARLDLVERAFDRLSVDERAVLVLHHHEHRSIPLIAASLGIPEGTVKSRLHTARRALKRALEAEDR